MQREACSQESRHYSVSILIKMQGSDTSCTDGPVTSCTTRLSRLSRPSRLSRLSRHVCSGGGGGGGGGAAAPDATVASSASCLKRAAAPHAFLAVWGGAATDAGRGRGRGRLDSCGRRAAPSDTPTNDDD